MIRLYSVMLIGEPFFLDGDPRELGFYRNEEERAVAKAKINTMNKLKRKAIKFIYVNPLVLIAGRFESGRPPYATG